MLLQRVRTHPGTPGFESHLWPGTLGESLCSVSLRSLAGNGEVSGVCILGSRLGFSLRRELRWQVATGSYSLRRHLRNVPRRLCPCGTRSSGCRETKARGTRGPLAVWPTGWVGPCGEGPCLHSIRGVLPGSVPALPLPRLRMSWAFPSRKEKGLSDNQFLPNFGFKRPRLTPLLCNLGQVT